MLTQRQKDETLDVDETAQWAASTAESIKNILNLCLFSDRKTQSNNKSNPPHLFAFGSWCLGPRRKPPKAPHTV